MQILQPVINSSYNKIFCPASCFQMSSTYVIPFKVGVKVSYLYKTVDTITILYIYSLCFQIAKGGTQHFELNGSKHDKINLDMKN
jgi:hypothetical protein